MKTEKSSLLGLRLTDTMPKKKELDLHLNQTTRLYTSNGFRWYIPVHSKLALPLLREGSATQEKLQDLSVRALKQDGPT